LEDLLDTTINKINSCTKEIEVLAKEEEVKPYYDKVLKKYQQKVSIPGFRKGKAPLNMILRSFGKEIDNDFKDDLINDFLKKIIQDEKIHPISRPQILKEDYKKGESFYFKIQIETIPEIELNQYKDIEIEKPVFQVGDEDVEAEFRRMIEYHKELIDDTKAIDDKYLITADIQETNEVGVPIIGQKDEDVKLYLDDPKLDEDIKKSLINCSVNDEIKIKMKNESQNRTIHTLFKVKKVQKIVYPEINEDLIKKMSNDKYSTPEELKEYIRTMLENEYTKLSDNVAMANFDNELLKRNDFDVPEGMIQSYFEEVIANIRKQEAENPAVQKIDEKEYKEKNRADAILRIKLHFLRSKIIEAENLKVDDVDLSIRADSESERTGIARERLMKYYQSSEDIKEKILQDKLDVFLKENNKITEKIYDRNQEKNKILTINDNK